ncbi:MAG: hypothetical protein KDD69_07565 [Bdellovibrionales bacterium]|nr:hypothetical protein [Bdellovibrionales bacterium]
MLLSSFRKKRRQDLFADREPARKGQFVSPLLEEWFAHWPVGCRLMLLELSGGSPGTLEAFSKLRAKIVVEDLASGLTDAHRAEPRLSVALQERDPFDLVFCWDILNYMEPAEISALGSQLVPISTDYTVVHALVSSLNRVPAQPGNFSVDDDGIVHYAFSATGDINSPRYSMGRMQKLFTGFEVDRMRLLKSGYYEVLLRRHRH